MDSIRIWVEDLISLTGIEGDAVQVLRHILLAAFAILLATFAGYLCRRLLVPLVLKLTAKTEARWDNILFNEQVLRSASHIVPAIVIWQLLPLVFYQFPTLREVLTRATAVYITIMSVRTIFVFINSIRNFDDGRRTSRQQYLYSLSGLLSS